MIKLQVNADIKKGVINKNIYGHFSEHLGRCIYEGIWVGKNSPIPNTDGIRNDVLEALKKVKIPILRWPGGCFADEYHWKDGIGPAENRPKMINTHWGGVVEDNSFGTHEFFRLCELIGAEPYINGNVGSGTVHEMQQWVEYMTFDGESPMSNERKKNGRQEPWKLKYFGIGNENWGCGGNMRPEYYADEFRRYGTYVRNFGDNKIYKIACGPNGDNYIWTEVLMKEAGAYMDGLSLHHYTLPTGVWADKGSATEFSEEDWFKTLKNTLFMEELVTKHSTVMDRYDPEKRVALIVDEWGTWYNVEPGTNPGFLNQQNTLRDALVAGINLNIFNNHCDRVRMANIAQIVNVLQCIIMTEGSEMLLTPTYHVFDMYKVHMDSELLHTAFDAQQYQFGDSGIPALSVSSSVDSNGKIHVSLCNLKPGEAMEIGFEIRGAQCTKASGSVLTNTAMNAHNTFQAPENVKPAAIGEIPVKDGKFTYKLPPMSVTTLELE